MTNIRSISIGDIRIDGGTQPRAKINLDVVSEYKSAIEIGANFPPVDVFFDGKSYWLADGFHRYHSARDAKLEGIEAHIHTGTQRDAILFAAGANAAHGLRRTNDDKRNSVMLLLNDAEWSKWSAREIADRCGVSHSFVNDIRQTVESASTVSDVKFKTSTGKTSMHKVKPVTETPSPKPQPAIEPRTDSTEIKSLGAGIRHAKDAINYLKKIPMGDALRTRGMETVTDWIKRNGTHKPVTATDVDHTRLKVRNYVQTLIDRIKPTSKTAVEALPGLQHDLEKFADEIQELADEIFTKTVAEKYQTEPAPPKVWSIDDDMSKFRALRDKLEPNWTDDFDRASMKRFFSQFANEISTSEAP